MSLAENVPDAGAEKQRTESILQNPASALLQCSEEKYREAREAAKTFQYGPRYMAAISLAMLGSMENDTLKKLRLLTYAALEMEELAGYLEAAQKTMAALHKRMIEHTIPEIMDNTEVDHFGLTDGSQVEVKDKVHANISKENIEAGCKVLVKHGAEGIIKRTISVPLNTKQGDLADKVLEAVTEALEGTKTQVLDERSVHHSTLSAWVREQLGEGRNISTEEMKVLGVHRRRMAVIKEKD